MEEQVLATNIWTDHMLDVKNIEIYVYVNPASQESNHLNQLLPSLQILINTVVRALNVSGSCIQLVNCPLPIPKEKQSYQSKNKVLIFKTSPTPVTCIWSKNISLRGL